MTTDLAGLATLTAQAERLIELGLHASAGLSSALLRSLVAEQPDRGLLAIHPDLLPASALVAALRVDDRPAFVVTDMADVDAFRPVEAAQPPASCAYVVHEPDRGDQMQDWTPDEALPAIAAAQRSPLTLQEALHWVLQSPGVLERNNCFMTIGSRLRKPSGKLDARTPALWFSNGTGRDGRERRDAPKVGWCWAGNRHTWLGFASAGSRSALGTPLTVLRQDG